MKKAVQRAELLKDMIQEAIEDGATTVEDVHQHIAGLPFDALEKLGLFEEQAASLKDKQRKTIGMVYDTIRRINSDIGSLISEQFAALEDAEAARKNMDKNADALPRGFSATVIHRSSASRGTCRKEKRRHSGTASVTFRVYVILVAMTHPPDNVSTKPDRLPPDRLSGFHPPPSFWCNGL